MMRLKLHETLYLYRRHAGRSQKLMAAMMQLKLHQYLAIERGDKPIGIIPPWTGFLRRYRPMERELCIIRRRRLGWTQQQLAQKTGWCRYYINLMEKGEAPIDHLKEFWRAHANTQQ